MITHRSRSLIVGWKDQKHRSINRDTIFAIVANNSNALGRKKTIGLPFALFFKTIPKKTFVLQRSRLKAAIAEHKLLPASVAVSKGILMLDVAKHSRARVCLRCQPVFAGTNGKSHEGR